MQALILKTLERVAPGKFSINEDGHIIFDDMDDVVIMPHTDSFDIKLSYKYVDFTSRDIDLRLWELFWAAFVHFISSGESNDRDKDIFHFKKHRHLYMMAVLLYPYERFTLKEDTSYKVIVSIGGEFKFAESSEDDGLFYYTDPSTGGSISGNFTFWDKIRELDCEALDTHIGTHVTFGGQFVPRESHMKLFKDLDEMSFHYRICLDGTAMLPYYLDVVLTENSVNFIRGLEIALTFQKVQCQISASMK